MKEWVIWRLLCESHELSQVWKLIEHFLIIKQLSPGQEKQVIQVDSLSKLKDALLS